MRTLSDRTQTLSDQTSNERLVESSGLSVADVFRPVLRAAPEAATAVRVEFWDGSASGPPDAAAVARLNRADALRRMLWMPNELGLARAYVAGDVDLDGDIFTGLMALRRLGLALRDSPAAAARLTLRAARRLGILGRPPPPPEEEAVFSGWRHSPARDARSVTHHYDVGNDFYRIVLGPSLTYSCARFVTPESTLEEAQAAKYELICRKLGLHDRPGARLLDVGCGWGSMALHAARHHDAQVVGITLSPQQLELARERVAEAGLTERIELRLQDYRRLGGEQFDAISSIGMAEHVGTKNLDRYFRILRSALVPGGRLLNHAISSVGGSKMGRYSFIGRYVFPDAELADVGDSVRSMERAGFEVRDVESLREHYARTLRHWVHNLEDGWDRAVPLVGEHRARIWRLYMAASAVVFDVGSTAIHQVLGVVPTAEGVSGMPATRTGWD